MNLIPSRMHYAEDDDQMVCPPLLSLSGPVHGTHASAEQKKAKKAKAKQPKQANPDDAADQTEKEGNKRALEDRDGPTPKKKKAKVESPPEGCAGVGAAVERVGGPGEKPAETPVAKPSEDVDDVWHARVCERRQEGEEGGCG